MKLTKQPNFEISGVVAKSFSISVSKMNRVLVARLSFDGLWLLLSGNVTTRRFDFSVSLKSRQNQKHPPSIELETLCTGLQIKFKKLNTELNNEYNNNNSLWM